MQALKSLQLSGLTESVLKSLSQNRITTVLSFLDEEVSKLSTITKLDLSQVLSVRNEIFAKFAAPLINGKSLLIKDVLNKNILNTGIERYNNTEK